MSPNILIERGYRVIIYTNDHTPAHVHVKKAEHEARVLLDPIGLLDHNGFRANELRHVIEIVQKHQAFLLSEWDKRHLYR